MKKFNAQFIVFLVLLFSATVAQAQPAPGKWSFSNPKPFGFWCWAISYANDNNALVVGEAGGIAKTRDGGGTWAYQCYVANISGEMVKPSFNDIHFVNTSLAYAVGNNGVMIKSIDGGINWTALTTPFSADNREINTVYFIDANTGYIGGDGDPVTRKSTLYKTINGGSTWTPEFEFPAPYVDWLSSALYKVRFNAAGVGYVGGAAGLVWKSQGGVWSDYSITDTTVYTNVNAEDTVYYDNGNGGFDTVLTTYNDNTYGLIQQNYRAIAIISDSEVVVGTQNNGGLIRINTSTTKGTFLMVNNGSALATKYSPLNSPQMYNFSTRNGSTIAGTSSNAQLLLSTDKGFTWQAKGVYPEGTPESKFGFFGVDISPANRIGLCGAGGVIADSVSTWRKPYVNAKESLGFSGYGIESISFADAANGIAAGSGGVLLRTNNGGNSWDDVSNTSFNPWDYYTSVNFISPTALLAAASNGMFYKSADMGTSFDLLFSEPLGGNLTAMQFINEDTGWMVANVRLPDMVNYVDTFHQYIYRTYDGGLSWDTSTTSFPYETDYSLNNYLYEIQFLNRNIGYAAGANGTIYKTTDGGLVWTKLSNIPVSEATKAIKSISIINQNVVYASGDEGLVMKSTDGGASWQTCNSGLPGGFSRFEKILMLDTSKGMTFANGNVYSTTDGGTSWSAFYVPLSDNFKAACFAPVAGCSSGNCKNVFAGGFFRGNIMKLEAPEGGPLPVKFSSLTGTGTSEGNQLFWTAFAQDLVSFFEIERSADGLGFQKIAEKVYPGGFNYQSYQWLDVTAAAGRNYYRIKATERNGAVYYTNIVVISSKKPAKWNYVLNNDNLILNNVKVEKGNVTAMVVNTAGQTVAAKSWSQNGGAFNQVLMLPPAAKGIYIVKVENEGAVYSFRIFIQ